MNKNKLTLQRKTNLSSLPKTWFDRGIALDIIKNCFQHSQDKIRIASGFFTIKGWGLIRKETTGKQVYILVGIEDPGEDRARKALIQEIMRDLRTGLDRHRRQSVLDLVNKIENEEFRLVDARATDHHAKIYLVDCIVAIIGSSNTTGKGLFEQIESGSLVIDTQEVKARVNDFDRYFFDAKDLTQELLEVLKSWLRLANPWDIYLKTMLALENLKPIKSNYEKPPTSYQVPLIARTLQQIRDFGGSMLVASTGLGKTIVAVHVALRLREAGEIDSVIVIAPKAVQSNWEDELGDASIHIEFFGHKTLDKDSPQQDRSLDKFEKVVKRVQANKRYLLIIDESHELRNRFEAGVKNKRFRQEDKTERQAFKRLEKLRSENVKILLLTGSPYGKELDNINNQLFLLPHTDSNRSLFDDSTYAEKFWKINEVDEFFDLPVASQLTIPYVAKHYSETYNGEPYINFGEQKRYIPKLILFTVDFSLPLEREIVSAIEDGYFDLTSPNPMYKDMIKRQVRVAWTSSPWAIRDVIQSVIDTPGGENEYKLKKLEFTINREQRQLRLSAINKKLERLDFEGDTKLKIIINFIIEITQNKEKIIVFCERRPTVDYLKKAFSELMPLLKVATTVEKINGKYKMKDPKEFDQLIKEFAPIANNAETNDESNYDILITTDAYGVGVNAQDASVVINYDIAWTPINPIQRTGRILRFWHLPRTVRIYTFIPQLNIDTEIKKDFVKIAQRWTNLIDRHQESKKLVDLSVLTSGEQENINVMDIPVRQKQLNLQDVADLDITSTYFRHTAKLQEHREYAENIPDDIISARTYSKNNNLIYVLLKYQEKYHTILQNLTTNKLIEPNDIELLNLIKCSEDTPPAIIDYDLVEELTNNCIQIWCDQKKIIFSEVERVCAMYLQSALESTTFDNFIAQE